MYSLVAASSEDDADNQAAVAAFGQVVAYCVTQSCRRAFVLGHFGEALPKNTCTGCDCCEEPDVTKAQVSCHARLLAMQYERLAQHCVNHLGVCSGLHQCVPW